MSETEKSKGGRPKVNATALTVRIPPEQLARLDKWAEAQPDKPSRPEAVRRLVEAGIDRAERKTPVAQTGRQVRN